MTVDQGFELHPGAAVDITDIWEFIAEDNPLAARRVREDILDAIRKLVPFPNQGHPRTDLTSRPLRFQTVRNYLIAYAPADNPLAAIKRRLPGGKIYRAYRGLTLLHINYTYKFGARFWQNEAKCPKSLEE